MTTAIAPDGIAVVHGPAWVGRWWRAFVRLLPLAGVYMLLVAGKNLPFHLAVTSTGWRIFLQNFVGEFLGGLFLVAFVAAVDVMPLSGRRRLLADFLAVLLTQVVSLTVMYVVVEPLGGFNGRFSFAQLLWGNSGSAAVESAFALVFYRLWQRSRQRAAALRDMQRAHIDLLRRTAEADLVAMRARMDPAFLLDTLKDVEGTYEADPRRGRRLIDALIEYLRAVLPGLDSTASTLAREGDIVRTHSEVARARGLSDAHLHVALAHWRRTPFPPMVVTPLVDDMLRSLRGSAARVCIEARGDAERLEVAIEVDRRFTPQRETSALVRRRLSELTAGGVMTVASGTHSSRILLELPHAQPQSVDR